MNALQVFAPNEKSHSLPSPKTLRPQNLQKRRRGDRIEAVVAERLGVVRVHEWLVARLAAVLVHQWPAFIASSRTWLAAVVISLRRSSGGIPSR